MKRITVLLTIILLAASITVFADETQVDISFVSPPVVLKYGEILSVSVKIANVNTPTVTSSQWNINGVAVNGWYNSEFNLHEGAIETFVQEIPFYYGMPKGATVSFDVVVNDELIRTETHIAFEEYSYEFYEEILRAEILKKIKPVEIEATLKKDSNYYSDKYLNNRLGILNSSTKVRYIDQYNKTSALVRTESGELVWILYNNLTIINKNYTVYSDHLPDDKEAFVNIKGYKSKTDYLIWINIERQKVNIFLGNVGNWRHIKSFPCVTGANVNPTPVGVYQYTATSPRWNFDGYYVHNVMYFEVARGLAMHSRLYQHNGKIYDDTMGTPASLGCVRLMDDDLSWMMHYIPKGTTVAVF